MNKSMVTRQEVNDAIKRDTGQDPEAMSEMERFDWLLNRVVNTKPKSKEK